MKCLFLTSSPGYGHTRAAEAIDAALRCRYPDIETQYLDITSLIDPQVSEAIQGGYLRMTAEQPDLYQKLYDLDKNFYRQLAGKIPADNALIEFLAQQQQQFFPEAVERSHFTLPVSYKSLDSALFNTLINSICNREKIPAGRLLLQGLLGLIYNILASRLKKFVNEYAPDFLIATQMYPNALLARSIEKGAITQPVIGVLTDYGTHGLWVRNTTSLYCVSHDEAAESLRRKGIAEDRICVTGIPLMPAFTNIPTQIKAQQDLGLNQQPTILITGGQCGIGVLDTVKRLLDDESLNYQVLVTTSNNTAEKKVLKALTLDYPSRFRVFGWCDDISHLICAADVVIGKPGGLTVSETLACGRPFIATCCLGGQEMHNVQFLRERGAGLLVELDQLPQTLREIFSNAEHLGDMKRNAYRLGRPNSARELVVEVERILRKKEMAYLEEVSLVEL